MIRNFTFLGTGSQQPHHNNMCSSLYMSTEKGEAFLFDCGEGTQLQFERTSGVKVRRISHIFITHLHGDHFFGLFGLICSFNFSFENPRTLKIFGPLGIKNAVETILAPHQIENLVFVELSGEKSIDLGSICDENGGGFRLSAHPLKHAIETFGYVLEESDRAGKLDVEKAVDLGVPKNSGLLGKLKNGINVILENGKEVESASVVSEKTPGKKFTFLQDTQNSDSAINKAMNSDFVFHECTYEAALESLALENGHSTSTMAGIFAKTVKAKTLFLTHFSARYKDRSQCRDEAAAVCPGTEVFAAEDLMTFERVGDEFFVVGRDSK